MRIIKHDTDETFSFSESDLCKSFWVKGRREQEVVTLAVDGDGALGALADVQEAASDDVTWRAAV